MSASVWNPGGQQQVPALPAVAPVSFVKNLISNPGINFVGDTDTGIWSESDGYLNLVCNGVTTLRIDPQGNVQGNKFATGVELTIASAAVTDIGSLATNSVQVTGNSTIGSFGTNYRGPMFVRFASALQLTYNSTQLITPGASNISVVAGDSCIVVPKATAGAADGWVIVSYQSAAPLLNAVSSINGGQLAGLRNRIINGGMQVAQRGTSGTPTAGLSYTLDRWQIGYGGTAPTYTQTVAAIPGVDQSASFLQAAGNGVTGCYFKTRIEAANCKDLAGQTVTLSWWAYQTTGSTMNVSSNILYANSADNFGATTLIALSGTTPVPNAVMTKVSAQFVVPNAATTGIEINLYANTPNLNGGAGINAAKVQLEIGSVATPFEQRPYGLERGLARNYYRVYATAQNVNDLGYDMRIVPTQAGAGPYTYNSEL